MHRASALMFAIVCSLFLAACGDDDGGGGAPSLVDEIEATDVGRYLGVIQPASSQANGAWTEYRYDAAAAEAICYTGMPYQVNVRPGTSNKVLLYLEGGGACWNASTCFGGAPLAKGFAGSAPNAGILDASIDGNPFADWNIVYAPYCDGSVFGGDNDATYGNRVAYHHGLQNLSAAVTRMLEAFPDPEQIVVAGSSAGGFGTYTGYGVVRIAYPETQVLVFDDSGPGIQNPDAAQDIQEREDNWQFQQFIPESCTRCAEQITYLTEWALDRDPDLRVGYFNYLQDTVLRFFLGVSAERFEMLLRGVTGDIHARQGERFRRFYPQGTTHTVLLSPEFYTREIDGTTVREWTAGLLDGTPVWRDLIE